MTRTFTLRSFLFTQGIFHSRKELNLNEFVEKSWSNIRIPLPRQFYPRLRSSTACSDPAFRFRNNKDPRLCEYSIFRGGYVSLSFRETLAEQTWKMEAGPSLQRCNAEDDKKTVVIKYSLYVIKSPICPDYSVWSSCLKRRINHKRDENVRFIRSLDYQFVHSTYV